MRLILTTGKQEYEGVLVKKDTSFIFLRLSDDRIKVWHWNMVEKLERFTRDKRVPVKLG